MDLRTGPPPKPPGRQSRPRRSGTITNVGYVSLKIGNRARQVHRMIAESLLGRWLLPDEDVHHIDGNRRNNEPSNLQVLGHWEHARSRGRGIPLVAHCARCGRPFRAHHYVRRSDPGTVYHQAHCSRRCGALAREQRKRAARIPTPRPSRTRNLAN
jgi:hypothetical protein